MKKVSKFLVMAFVVLAVVTMSLSVNAAASHDILIQYIREPHNVNGILFELTNSQKNAITDYINTLDESTAAAVHADIVSMEETIRSTGAKSTSQISKSVKTDILARAKDTATKAGLTLTVNTNTRTFTLTKANNEVLASGSYISLATNPGTSSGNTASSSTGAKLLYTGANYLVYAVPVLAIVAVAIIVKKRA